MPELSEVAGMLEAARRAATGGDFANADELLRDAARIQEAELGPYHPDLANTLNNLAIVSEKTGRPADAETFYRRASAIASASLPADHPMVVESRRNLEDFCRARGLAIDPVAGTAFSASDAALGLDAFPEEPSVEEKRPVTRAVTPPTAHVATPTPAPAAPRTQRSMPSQSAHAGSREPRSVPAWVIGAVIVVVVALLIGRAWWSRPASTDAPPSVPTPSPPAAVANPIEPAQPSKDTPPPISPPAERPSTSDVSVIARLCQNFSTSDATWKCEPAGNPASPGPLVLYTRVKSARDVAVVHRWYRGDTLYQSVKLTVRANATEGYRTFSRQTVNTAESWRVEVQSAAGDLLYEQRFTVR